MAQKSEIQQLIFHYRRRLQLLKEQQARRGLLAASPEILTEIEVVTAKIDELQVELARLDDDRSTHDLTPETQEEVVERQIDIKKLISIHLRRLQILKEREAKFGLTTPPEIILEIEDTEAEVKNLQASLEELEGHNVDQSYTPAQIRRALTQYFHDPGFDAFSQDYFPEVYQQFGRGMTKNEKIDLLLDYCRRTSDGWNNLITVLQQEKLIDMSAPEKSEVIDIAQTEPTEQVEPPVQAASIDTQTLAAYLEVVRGQCGQVETRPYFQLSRTPGAPPSLPLIGEQGRGGVYIPLNFDLPHQSNVDLTAVLADPKHLVIVGGAGSGKTTVLRFVAITLAAQDPLLNRVKLAWTVPTLPLPIFVTLRDFEHACQTQPETYRRTPDSLLRFIDGHFQHRHPERIPADFLSNLVKSGFAWLLLDGLDEVANFDHRVTLRHLIEDLAAISPQNRILVTARVAAYTDPRTQLNAQFAAATVRDLTREQWQPMLKRIYTGLERRPDLSKQRAELLTARIDASPLLQNMVKTPLMVWTATIIHYTGSELPEQRAELYNAYVDVLLGERLHEEESAEAAQSLREEGWPMEDRRLYLTQAAFEVHQMAANESAQVKQSHSYVVDETELVTILRPFMQNYLGLDRRKAEQEAKEFVRMMAERSGLLHAHEGGYSFGDHLTVQEFLTAYYLVENVRHEPDKWAEFLQGRVGQSWWQQVFMLMSGCLLKSPKQANRFLLDELGNLPGQGEAPLYGLAWAGRALLEIPPGRVGWYGAARQELSRRLADRLSQSQGKIGLAARLEAGQVLGLLGDPRFLDEKGRLKFISVGEEVFWMGSQAAAISALLQQMPLDQLISQLQLSRRLDPGEDVLLKAQQILASEQPCHPVCLKPFGLAPYPTTNVQFATFMDEGGYSDPRWWPEGQAAGLWREGKIIDSLGERIQPAYWQENGFNGSNQPVVGLTWYEAMAYCRWLTHRLREQRLLDQTELIRLPTEAEWERVAGNGVGNGDGSPSQGLIYPWGNTWSPQSANIIETGLERTTPVGIFPAGATATGIFDLAGNVSEWCWDWFEADAYRCRAGQTVQNPAGPADGEYKVLRGGSWQHDQYFVRSAFRDRETPQSRSRTIGFRLVKSTTSKLD